MIIIDSTERTFYKLRRVFFSNIINDFKDKSVDIIRFLRNENNLEEEFGVLKDTVYTLVSYLDNENDILNRFNKTVKYEIKRCAEKDNINIHTYFSKQLIDKKVIEDFKNVYDNFCETSKQLKLKKDFNKNKIQEYIDSNCVFVSCVEYNMGKTYHMCVIDGETALLVYSASDFRNKSVDKNLAARANKYLHYIDLCTFMKLGYKKYDWGNVSSFLKPNGIDIFKMSFGGEQKTLYNYFVGQTIKGKILVEIKKRFR